MSDHSDDEGSTDRSFPDNGRLTPEDWPVDTNPVDAAIQGTEDTIRPEPDAGQVTADQDGEVDEDANSETKEPARLKIDDYGRLSYEPPPETTYATGRVMTWLAFISTPLLESLDVGHLPRGTSQDWEDNPILEGVPEVREAFDACKTSTS